MECQQQDSLDTAVPPPTTGFVRHLVAYMHANYAEPIRLVDLERLSHRTTWQIIRAFRSELGQTPHAYLLALRTHQAISRLQRGEAIAEAAVAVGFADQSHLARNVKKRAGRTPGSYLNAHRLAAAS